MYAFTLPYAFEAWLAGRFAYGTYSLFPLRIAFAKKTCAECIQGCAGPYACIPEYCTHIIQYVSDAASWKSKARRAPQCAHRGRKIGRESGELDTSVGVWCRGSAVMSESEVLPESRRPDGSLRPAVRSGCHDPLIDPFRI